MQSTDYQPIIIIGAPRSGTNMLRDVLCQLEGVNTWPCDEINYIWRHGNLRFSSDEFTVSMASPSVKTYTQKKFDWLARKHNSKFVVEKTCANSLRVAFVDEVIPGAKFIFIRRDGLDVVGSAMKRWKAPLDIPYLLKKVRFVPVLDLPYYAIRYFNSRIHRLFSKEGRLSFWGPRLGDMKELLSRHSLSEICAIQWQRCVVAAANDFSGMPSDKWMEVKYEDFAETPAEELKRILDFVGIEADAFCCEKVTAKVRADSIGKGRSALSEEEQSRIRPLIKDTLEQYGYD